MVLIGCGRLAARRGPRSARADERLRRIVVPLALRRDQPRAARLRRVGDLNPVAVGLAAASLVAVMARTMLTFRDNVAHAARARARRRRPTR